MVASLIFVLALAGLIISLYFTLAYYGRIRKAHWIPEVLCAREGSSCVTVLQTPYARVLGIPNSLLGIIYYILVMAWALKDWSTPVDLYIRGAHLVLGNPVRLLIALSAATVILGFYLIYALRRWLRVDCPLCYTAHAINAVLLVLLVALVA